MPSTPLVFRATCGCFQPVYQAFMLIRAREKAISHIAILTPRCRTDGVMLGLLLTLLFWGGFLLRCGDVERNPGPPKQDPLKQTRLTNSRRRTSLDRTASTSGSGQSTPPSPSPDPPTLTDVMAKLTSMENTMNCKFITVEQHMDELSEQLAALRGEVEGLRVEVGDLHQKNQDLVKTNTELTKKIDALEKKTDDLECRSKRNNLIFHGIKRRPNETNDECEGIVKDLLTDKLDVPHDVQFDRVHRLGGKPDSPIIARCCFYKDKVRILKEKRKLKGSSIFIGEDFSSRVRDKRRKLSPFLKQARESGRRAFMVFDHLVIDDKKFCLNEHDSLCEYS